MSIQTFTQSYFQVPKDARLNTTHFFITKISKKREAKEIAIDHSSDIDFKDFIELYKKYATHPHSILANNPLCFWKNLLKEV